MCEYSLLSLYSYYHVLNLQTEDEQQGIIKEVFHMVSRRDDTVCNFLEGPTYVIKVIIY